MKVNKTKKRLKTNKFRKLKTNKLRRRQKTNKFRKLKTKKRLKTNKFRRQKTNKLRRTIINNNKQFLGGNPLSCFGDRCAYRADRNNISELYYRKDDVVGYFVLSSKNVGLYKGVPGGVYHQTVVIMVCVNTTSEDIEVILYAYDVAANEHEDYMVPESGFWSRFDGGVLQINRFIILDRQNISFPNEDVNVNVSIAKLQDKGFNCSDKSKINLLPEDITPLAITPLAKVYTINKSDPRGSIRIIVNDFKNSDAVSYQLYGITNFEYVTQQSGGGPTTLNQGASQGSLHSLSPDALEELERLRREQDSVNALIRSTGATLPRLPPQADTTQADTTQAGIQQGLLSGPPGKGSALRDTTGALSEGVPPEGIHNLPDREPQQPVSSITISPEHPAETVFFRQGPGKGAEITRKTKNNQNKLFFIDYNREETHINIDDIDNLVMDEGIGHCCSKNYGEYNFISNNCRDFVNCMLPLLKQKVEYSGFSLKLIRKR
jgi:hypothetical protein